MPDATPAGSKPPPLPARGARADTPRSVWPALLELVLTVWLVLGAGYVVVYGLDSSRPVKMSAETMFSPDGARVVSFDAFRFTQIWNASDGSPAGKSIYQGGTILDASFSPDGRILLTAGSNARVKFWDTSTGEQIGSTLVLENYHTSGQFCPDGKRFVTASGKTAQFWTAPTAAAGTSVPATFSPVGPPMLHKTDLEGLSLNADGSRMITWCEGEKEVYLWDTTTCALIATVQHRRIADSSGRREGCSFTRDGTRLVTITDRVNLWDSATGKLVVAVGPGKSYCSWREYEGGAYPASASYSQPGSKGAASPRMLVCSHLDRTYYCVSTETGASLGPPIVTGEYPRNVDFSPDGTCILTIEKNVALLWDVATGKPIVKPMIHDSMSSDSSIRCTAFSPDGKYIITGTYDPSARLWDAKTGNPVGAPLVTSDNLKDVAFTPDGRLAITCSYHDNLRLWEVPSGKLVPVPGAGTVGDIRSNGLIFNKDKTRMLAITFLGASQLWDVTSPARLIRQLR